MEKYRVVNLKAYTIKGIVKKTEKYLNEVSAKGLYEVVSVSFIGYRAIITWRLK